MPSSAFRRAPTKSPPSASATSKNGRRSLRLYSFPFAPLKSGSLLSPPEWSHETWLESIPPSSACSQFDSCQRFDVYVCSGGTWTNSNSGSGGCSSGSPMYVQRMSPTRTSGYDVSLTLRAKLLFSGSEGTSTHWPVTSYFQPWYAQRRPHSSTRPNQSETPRCAQNSSISP